VAAAAAAPASSPAHTADYLDNPKPDYPDMARQLGEQGRVLLLVEVGADGRVRRASVRESCGYDDLDHAALRAVRRWRFVPARAHGHAVDSWVTVPIDFTLGF
jgi:protein TonB